MTVTPLLTDMAGSIPFLSRKEALQFSALKLVRDVRSQSHPPPYYLSIFSSSFQYLKAMRLFNKMPLGGTLASLW